MTDTITQERSYSGIELSFSWTPATTYTINSVAYPAAQHNVLLTFTADVVFYNQGFDLQGPLTVVEYIWDFGDGVIGYGNPVTHTYNQPYFNASTHLKVYDSLGRLWTTRAQMYLT